MVPGDGRDYCGMTWLGKATEVLGLGIEALSSVLPLLTALRTFSIIVYSGLRMNGVEDYLGTYFFLACLCYIVNIYEFVYSTNAIFFGGVFFVLIIPDSIASQSASSIAPFLLPRKNRR
jgi:hypothetical protein